VKIVVLGLGHLGSTVAACALADGHHVVGVDPDPQRWSAMNGGASPVFEPGVASLLQAGHADGRLSAGADLGDVMADADIAVVCVGTPMGPSGTLDLSQVMSVTEAVGLSLRRRLANRRPLALVYRSTLTPGTMDGSIVPLLRLSSGIEPGGSYEAFYNPEFLREGSAIEDYRAPSRIIIGERFAGATDLLLGLNHMVGVPVYELTYVAAELAKLADNSFHALKTAFANELGRYANSLGIDPQRVADVLLADRKFNVSESYLRPGGPFGGPCLAKDTQALVHAMSRGNVSAPLLASVVASNEAHYRFLLQLISALVPEPSNVLIVGLGFKAGSDDLRDSPALILAAALLAAGHRISVFDPDVANVEDFRRRLPAQIAACWVHDVRDAASCAALVVAWKPMAHLPSAANVIDVQNLRVRARMN
jgi:GDP-mannose 6-dehydrogenase